MDFYKAGEHDWTDRQCCDCDHEIAADEPCYADVDGEHDGDSWSYYVTVQCCACYEGDHGWMESKHRVDWCDNCEKLAPCNDDHVCYACVQQAERAEAEADPLFREPTEDELDAARARRGY